MSFTPGPWRAVEKYGNSVAVKNEWDVWILASSVDDKPERWKADARLIAAAPEMYDALNRLAAMWPATQHIHMEMAAMYPVIEDLLAKARGEA